MPSRKRGFFATAVELRTNLVRISYGNTDAIERIDMFIADATSIAAWWGAR